MAELKCQGRTNARILPATADSTEDTPFGAMRRFRNRGGDVCRGTGGDRLTAGGFAERTAGGFDELAAGGSLGA